MKTTKINLWSRAMSSRKCPPSVPYEEGLRERMKNPEFRAALAEEKLAIEREENASLTARVEKLRAALEFYADKDNWSEIYLGDEDEATDGWVGDVGCKIDLDDVSIIPCKDLQYEYAVGGKRAREALEETLDEKMDPSKI